MKKLLYVFLVVCNLLCLYMNTFAAELPINDVQIVGNEIEILTEIGKGYSSMKDISTQDKKFVMDDVKALDGDYFIGETNDNRITANAVMYIMLTEQMRFAKRIEEILTCV